MIVSRLKAMRFQTKVLVSIVSVMVLLMAVTMYVVNYRLTRQLQNEAAQALTTAEAVFKNSQKSRQKTLHLQLRNIPNAPHYRATFQKADAPTITDMLDKNVADFPGDIVVYKAIEGQSLRISVRDSTLDLKEFKKNGEMSVKQALDGMPNTDTIRVSDRLFDIVSLPVTLPVSGEVIGVLTFCSKFGQAQAQELSETTGCGIVLIANNHVVASSLRRRDLLLQCVSLFDSSVGGPFRNVAADVREIIVPQEHFLPRVGRFESQNGDPKLGYVLLYSYSPALQELRATQRMIVGASLVGIIFASAVVWLFIRNITKPLRQLRDSAEAVGRGDFTHRVNVRSQDECGELAVVFNRMTESLQSSRQKLEETVTTLKSTQAQLVQSEKLSAIGEFVAGVTHELNNPLTSLLGFSELLQQSQVDERQRRFVDRIAASARRCQKIVQSLLSFARRRAPERKVTDLNEVVEAVIEIMAYEMRTSNIEVIPELQSGLPKVLADSHQLQQVFVNIVNNARQAMEAHQPSGQLRIHTESLNGRVRVTFQDNGPGISGENLKKIFDPFFTTKEVGQGTGLGLSLSYGIVQEHGGTIRAQSELGQGAAFVIELPVHTAKEPIEKNEVPSQTSASAKGDGKRVLVIDDEETILDFVSEVLSADGYKVDTARDGAAALQRLRQARYDLALCDWKMPGMSGQNLFERVSNDDPDTARRFIFMTGDVINHKAETFLKEHQRVCLSKPFSISEFRNVVGSLAQAA